jgi:hypothetical protein
MKQLLLLCLFFILLSPLSAQKDFSPGSIILHHGDTVHGAIAFRFRNVNPDKITFLDTANQDTSAYTPQEIKAFMIRHNHTDHYYESHILKKHYFPDSAAHRPSENQDARKGTSQFLYVYLKGKPYSLYYYQDKRPRFYLQKEGEYLHELPNPNVQNQNGSTLPMEKYKRQLFYFLADWPEASQRIRSTRYNYQSLLKIFRDYNHFKAGSGKQIYLYQEAPKKIHAGILAGLSTTHLSFTSREKEFYYLSNGLEQIYPSPALGLFFHIPVSNRLPSLSLYNELAYRSYKVHIEYTDHEDFWHSRTSSRFDVAYLRLSSLLRWRMAGVRYSPFVQAGPWYSYTIREENVSTISRYNHFHNTYSPYHTREAVENFLPFELGISVGAGLCHRNFSAELRFDLGNGMSHYTALSARTYAAGLFLSYRLL